MHPETSTTLLRDLAGSAGHVRWSEFFARYEPMMRAFLASRFPGVEADDILQETMLALVRVLPNYRYDPEHHGFFRDYLIGILRNKALDALRKLGRRQELERQMLENREPGADAAEQEHVAWIKALFATALQEFLADPAITERRKQAFCRVSVKGEPRAKVAEDLGVSLNVVNLSVSRSIRYLQEKVGELRKP